MKIHFLFVIIFLFSTCTVFSQTKITKYHFEGKGKIKEQYTVSDNDSTKIDGDYFAYDVEGNLAVKGHYSMGVRNGEFQNFYPNGVVQRITIYKNGLKEGIT